MNPTLKQLLTNATPLARQLVAEAAQGKSPFAAAIRSALDHVNELVAQHEAWVAANPPDAPAPAAPKS